MALAVLAALLLTGCWNRYETNELSIPDGLGFDWSNGQYAAIASAYNTRAAVSPGGQGGGSATDVNLPETLFLTGHGAAPGLALTDIDHVSSRHVLWAPAGLVLIGQGAAQHGIAPILEALAHEPWFRPTIRIMVAHGSASQILQKRQSGPETSISRALVLISQTSQFDQSTSWAPHLFDVYRMDAEQGRSYLLPAVSNTDTAFPQGPPYSIADSAVMTNDRLVAWLPRHQVRMALWMDGRFTRGTFAITCGGGPGAINVYQAGQRVQPILSGSQVTGMSVQLTGRATVVNPCPSHDLSTIQSAADAAVQADAASTINWIKSTGYDVAGFGEDVYRVAPGAWSAVGQQWPATLVTLAIRLKVQITVAGSGITRP